MNNLIGKHFKYKSKHGLSTWSSPIDEIMFEYSYDKDTGHFNAIPCVRTKDRLWYYISEVVIVDEKASEIHKTLREAILKYKGYTK